MYAHHIINLDHAEMLWLADWSSQASKAGREGWDIFATGRGFELQREDDTEIFHSDNEAWDHVWRRANEGSTMHMHALAFLYAHDPHEFARIERWATTRRRRAWLA